MSDSGFAEFGEVFAQLKHVDDPDVHERARTNPALAAAYKMLRPANWLDSGLTPGEVLSLAVESGIPVCGVPPPRVLADLAAADPDDRMDVLGAHEASVLELCATLIEESDDPAIRDTQTLTRCALRAFADGHHEAAMALAVAVCERLAIDAAEREVRLFASAERQADYDKAAKSKQSKYKTAARSLDYFDPQEDGRSYLMYGRALLSPVPKFFTPYYPDQGDPIPETTSRHAAVHNPTVEHLSKENALIALMLCTSLLRDLQSWREYEHEQQLAWEEGIRDQERFREEQAREHNIHG